MPTCLDISSLPAVETGLDLLMLLPPMAPPPMLPRTVGLLERACKRADLRVQVMDLNRWVYRRFHASAVHPASDDSSAARIPNEPWQRYAGYWWGSGYGPDYFWPWLDSLPARIAHAAPKIVAMDLQPGNQGLAQRLGEALRRQASGVMLSGFGSCCRMAEIVSRSFADWDYLFLGDAEDHLPTFLRHLLRGARDETSIPWPGAAAHARLVPPSASPPPLEAAGFPRYEWTDIQDYSDRHGVLEVPISMTRSCWWGRCTFCGEQPPFRKRNPETVLAEIAHWTARDVTRFVFVDCAINNDFDQLQVVADGMARLGKDLIVSGAQFRVDTRNTPELFRRLRRAGFRTLRFGVDGWTPKLRKLMGKGFTLEIARANLQACANAGIEPLANLLVGVPGETEEDVEDLRRNLASMIPPVTAIGNLSTLQLLAGCKYRNYPEQYNIRFHKDRDILYSNYPELLPSRYWYSEEPYIDGWVRLERMARIIDTIGNAGIELSPDLLRQFDMERQQLKSPMREGMTL